MYVDAMDGNGSDIMYGDAWVISNVELAPQPLIVEGYHDEFFLELDHHTF